MPRNQVDSKTLNQCRFQQITGSFEICFRYLKSIVVNERAMLCGKRRVVLVLVGLSVIVLSALALLNQIGPSFVGEYRYKGISDVASKLSLSAVCCNNS